MMLIYLTQLPLFAAGPWLGVEASVIASVVGLGILVADSSLPTAAVFAGLSAVPVVLLVRRALLARPNAGGGVDWYPPGLLTAWLTGLGLAVIAAVVLVLGGLVSFCLAGLAVLHVLAALQGWQSCMFWHASSRPVIPLVTFYVLAGLFGWPLLLVALWGCSIHRSGCGRASLSPRGLEDFDD
jgi:hypothetical protein